MTPTDYFVEAYKNGYLTKYHWYYTFLSILIPDNFQPNEWLEITDGSYIVKLGNEQFKLDGVDPSKPIIDIKATVKATPSLVKNLSEPVETTIGRLIVNYVMVERAFGQHIPFNNGPINLGKLETQIAYILRTKDEVSTDAYVKYVDGCGMIKSIAPLINVSATKKSLLPPPNIAEVKNKLIKEFNETYGENWVKDRNRIAVFRNRLQEVDKEWLKDDPAYGALLSGKITNDARPKMYLNFGAEPGFDKKGENVRLVENSLLEGYPKDKDQLARMYNTARAGSYDRGVGTQKGGTAAKEIFRALSSTTVENKDCGATIGKPYLVTKDNVANLTGRYIIDSKGAHSLDDFSPYIGKVIQVRSPMYCKNKGNSFCETCMGKYASRFKNGISLQGAEETLILLYISMKSMHASALNTIDFDITKVIK